MSRLSDYAKFDHLDDASSSDDEDHHDHRNNDINPDPDHHRRPPNPTAGDTASSNASTSSSAPHAAMQPQQLHPPPQPQSQLQQGVVKTQMTKRGSEVGRYVFEHGGRKIYEWEQSLEEVNVYIDAPPGLESASQIECVISPTHLTLGLKNADTGRPYLDEDTFSKVCVSDSSWCVTDLDKRGGSGGVINIVLAKAFRGETWDSVLLGAHRREGGDNAVVDPATREEIQKDLMIERFQEEHPGFDFRGAEFNGSVPDPRTFMGGVKYS